MSLYFFPNGASEKKSRTRGTTLNDLNEWNIKNDELALGENESDHSFSSR
jgi:hypothetical protein